MDYQPSRLILTITQNHAVPLNASVAKSEAYHWHVLHLTNQFDMWELVCTTCWPYLTLTKALTHVEDVLGSEMDIHLCCVQL